MKIVLITGMLLLIAGCETVDGLARAYFCGPTQVTIDPNDPEAREKLRRAQAQIDLCVE